MAVSDMIFYVCFGSALMTLVLAVALQSARLAFTALGIFVGGLFAGVLYFGVVETGQFEQKCNDQGGVVISEGIKCIKAPVTEIEIK